MRNLKNTSGLRNSQKKFGFEQAQIKIKTTDLKTDLAHLEPWTPSKTPKDVINMLKET